MQIKSINQWKKNVYFAFLKVSRKIIDNILKMKIIVYIIYHCLQNDEKTFNRKILKFFIKKIRANILKIISEFLNAIKQLEKWYFKIKLFWVANNVIVDNSIFFSKTSKKKQLKKSFIAIVYIKIILTLIEKYCFWFHRFSFFEKSVNWFSFASFSCDASICLCHYNLKKNFSWFEWISRNLSLSIISSC